QNLPLGLVLRPELPPTTVEAVTPRVSRQRINQQGARARISRRYQLRGILKIEPRLLSGPVRASGSERLQIESPPAGSVAHNTACALRTLLEEDRLNTSPIEFKIERLRRCELHGKERCPREFHNG